MTKKKEQKTQDDTSNEAQEDVLDDNKNEDLATQLLEAQQSAKDNWDKLLRSQAEMENLKRRTSKDLENAHKYALDGFVKALLEVNDSLSMGLKLAMDENATLANTIEGIELTNKVFMSTLEKFGVEAINPVDEKFNPELHEAVTMAPMPDIKHCFRGYPDKISNTVVGPSKLLLRFRGYPSWIYFKWSISPPSTGNSRTNNIRRL